LAPCHGVGFSLPSITGTADPGSVPFAVKERATCMPRGGEAKNPLQIGMLALSRESLLVCRAVKFCQKATRDWQTAEPRTGRPEERTPLRHVVRRPTSLHYARTPCCDRGYGRPSLRAVGSPRRKPGVLGSSFGWLRSRSPGDVLASTPQVGAPAAAPRHDHLHDLATASRA
jgi:hypothetical protein